MKVLITGAAGFIGYHLCKQLLERGDRVLGIDNLNDYYDVNLKLARLEGLKGYASFEFIKLDIADRAPVEKLFQDHQFDRVVNLAAQAGVRYSIENPHAYVNANMVGFINILEGCRHTKVPHLAYASSSSVYGANSKQPFAEEDTVDHPVSLYAASKKANELMAHAYSNLYQLPTTGLRFFTVYGPWGRPDMAPFLFTKGVVEGTTINIYNQGNMYRDFTYIDDIVEGVVRATDKIPTANKDWDSSSPDPASSFAPYKIYNIGNNTPVKLMDFVEAIENAVGKKAIKNFMPMQPGDVPSTFAEIRRLEADVGFKPATPLQAGIDQFVQWYKNYFEN
ncbi:MAG: NAD-dependent epimerase [Cellvibrionaceae bacterium]|nr:NAD-dependent epimerase [Cellvibrionaceae bacterium]